jgi:hypothetical protein
MFREKHPRAGVAMSFSGRISGRHANPVKAWAMLSFPFGFGAKPDKAPNQGSFWPRSGGETSFAAKTVGNRLTIKLW